MAPEETMYAIPDFVLQSEIRCVCGRVYRVKEGARKKCACGATVELVVRLDGFNFANVVVHDDYPVKNFRFRRPKTLRLRWTNGAVSGVWRKARPRL